MFQQWRVAAFSPMRVAQELVHTCEGQLGSLTAEILAPGLGSCKHDVVAAQQRR